MLYNYSKKDYTDHLDPYYDGYLGLLFRHVIEPSVFFKKFGTHILMRGTFGCEYDINYSVLSSSATFSTNIVINAADKIGGNIINSMLKKAEIESDIDFSLNTLFEQEIDDASVNLKMSCKCETPTIFLNFSDMKNNYNTSINNWNSDNAVFLTASHEGYIPLWEFIPDKYATQRQWFIDECKNYIRNNCLDLKNIEDELYSLDKVEKPCLIRADELAW